MEVGEWAPERLIRSYQLTFFEGVDKLSILAGEDGACQVEHHANCWQQHEECDLQQTEGGKREKSERKDVEHHVICCWSERRSDSSVLSLALSHRTLGTDRHSGHLHWSYNVNENQGFLLVSIMSLLSGRHIRITIAQQISTQRKCAILHPPPIAWASDGS